MNVCNSYMKLIILLGVIQMQRYYLHNQFSPQFKLSNLRAYRINEDEEVVIGSRGTQLEIYKLLDDDLNYQSRYLFHANIDKIQVIPSKFHRFDYLWILDTKGRFCFWNPQGVNIANNTILWDENQQSDCRVFSGVKYQFEQKQTEGNIFYSKGQIFVLLNFTVNQKGIEIDQGNIIKYTLQPLKVRFMDWVQHSQCLFLVGVIVEEENTTALCIYDLEKGLGLCSQALQWRYEKTNLLQFYSVVAGQVLILTYNQISLHNYKQNYPLKIYRTRGNYGQGFYLQQGLYGHIGQELITFNRDKLVSYGQVKTDDLASFSHLCLTHCKVLGKINNGAAIILETYQGDVYFLRIFSKTFTIYRIVASIGPIVDICSISKSESLLGVVNKSSSGFELSLLQKQYSAQVKEQNKLQNKAIQKMMTINGGIYIIMCSDNENQVFRLTRNQEYQSYFLLPQGNILAADGQFIVYENAIFEVDYQCFALSPLEELEVLLAEIVGDIIYFLDSQGIIHFFDNEEDVSNVILTGRQEDYCWGSIKKSNVLLTANLKQPKTIRMIHKNEVKSISIKGHTLVSSISSISYRKSRYESDQRILVGYSDGQIHMHNMRNDTFYSTYVFETVGSMPVSFCACGDDTVLANFVTKQYLITASKDQYKIMRVCFSNYSAFTYLVGFLQKSAQLVYFHSNSNGFIKKMGLNAIKKSNNFEQSKIFRAVKLQEWSQSVPMLLKLNDRLLVAGQDQIRLFNLQTTKAITTFHHNLAQIIGLSQIKMGIILCGICPNKTQYIVLLTQQLQLILRLQLHSSKPVRCMKVIQGQNEFFLAYDNYLTLYKITDSLQLISLMGSKINLEAYHLDINRNNILINDPFRNLSVLQYTTSINSLATYLSPYTIVNASFIGKDILYVDQRGSITILATQIEQIIDLVFKFNKISTIHVGAKISAVFHSGDTVYYATEQGKIGIIKQISRDEFDSLKKIQTEVCLQMDQNVNFCYWQWRSKVPAHERIIDGQLLGDKIYEAQHQVK